MKKWNKLVSITAAATILALTACGQTAGSNASQASATQTQQETAENSNEIATEATDNPYAVTEPVTIEFWSSMEDSYTVPVCDAFNESQDLVTVVPVYVGNYAAIKEQIAAAQAAQDGLPGLSVINYPQVITYADSGVAEPLDAYMEAYGYESDFYQGFVDPLIVDGQQYAFPYGPSTTVVYYNKDLLQEVSGLTEFPSTWEETKTWAEEFHKATGKSGLSTPGAGSTFNYVNTLLLNTGVDPIGDGCLMGDEKVVTWVKDMKTLVEDGAIEWVNTGSSTETDLKTKFINGETAAIVYSSTFYDTALETVDFDIGVTLVPENANNLSTTAGATLFIPAQNDQNVKNAAFQFLTFITNEENAKEFALESAYLPTRKSLLEGDNINDFLALYPDMINIYNNMDTIVAKNPSPYFTKAITAIGEDLSLIFNGGQDVDETIPKIVEEVNYILEGN